MSATAVSSMLGFAREIVTARYYGTQSDLDAFINASTVPLVLFGIFNGSLTGALVPTFSGYASLGRDDELRKLGSTVINVLCGIMIALAIVGWVLAPAVVSAVAHGFPAEKQQLEVRMVRWLMPSVVATTLSGVCAALLNVNHRFVASSLNTIATNIVIIGCIVLLEHRFGIFAIVFGSLFGLWAQLLVQVPAIIRYRLYHFTMDLRHPGLAEALALFIPVTIGAGGWQVNLAFDRYFASTLSSGSTAGLAYATKVAFLPILIVAGSISTVIFPLIAGQFAKANIAGIRRSVSLALRAVTFIVIPCAVTLVTISKMIVQTLFERGAFTPKSTEFCATLIPFAAIPLVAISYNVIMARTCYACKKMKPPVISSFFTIGINIVLSATLLPLLGARGLLLANGLSMLFGTVFLLCVIWRLASGLEWKPMVSSLVRVMVASLVMAGTLVLMRSVGFVPSLSVSQRPWYLAFLLVIAASVYVGVAHALRVEELSLVIEMVRKKFSRSSLRSGDREANTLA